MENDLKYYQSGPQLKDKRYRSPFGGNLPRMVPKYDKRPRGTRILTNEFRPSCTFAMWWDEFCNLSGWNVSLQTMRIYYKSRVFKSTN